jgi:transposase
MMLPEDMRLWVGRDHFVWFLIEVSGGLDLAGLEGLGKPGKGRPGYDPAMMAVLLLYGYCRGVRSSRKIEERCRTDAAFRVATGNLVPDHATICRFRSAAAQEGGPLEDLFTQVLFAVAAAGLGRLGVISVDGSKIWADASKQANRTEQGLRKLARKILDEAARADGEGCGCQGHQHGEAAGLADLQAARAAREQRQRAAAGQYLDAARAGHAPLGRVPAVIEVAVAELRLERAIAARRAQMTARAQAAAAGTPRRGARPAGEGKQVRAARGQLAAARARQAAHDQAARAEAGPGKKKPPQPVRNITDPDSRVMHCTLRGAVQAYNCQVPRTGDGVFLLPRAVSDPNDAAQVTPALHTIARCQQIVAAGHAAGGRPAIWSRIGTILFDPGYFSQSNCEIPGPDRLIGTGAWEDPGPHSPGCDHGDPRDQMHHNLATRQGRDLYRRRAPISEGGFAELKDRIGLRRFSLRGRPKVNGELTLAATAANLLLLHRHAPRPA